MTRADSNDNREEVVTPGTRRGRGEKPNVRLCGVSASSADRCFEGAGTRRLQTLANSSGIEGMQPPAETESVQ